MLQVQKRGWDYVLLDVDHEDPKPDTEIVLATVYSSDSEDLEVCVGSDRSEFLCFISRSFTHSDLLAVVRRALRSHYRSRLELLKDCCVQGVTESGLTAENAGSPFGHPVALPGKQPRCVLCG